MKTGRTRKKAEAKPDNVPIEQTAPGEQVPAKPAPAPATPRPVPRPAVAAPQGRRAAGKNTVLYVFIGVVAVIAVIAILTLLRGRPKEWVPVSRADGTWVAGVTVFGPQVAMVERWEADCIQDPNGEVQAGTCFLKDTDTYKDLVVDDYEEYAYTIYYEETWQEVYNAQGTEFVVTSLGQDDYWEGNRHTVRVEELDKDTCSFTNYTVWVDNAQDRTQEVEVYLSECEVWDHVTVYERTYDQQLWCQCGVTSLVAIGQQSEQGTGATVLWPQPDVPAGGNTQSAFSGKVTFLGGDYTYTLTTSDLNEYQQYLTGQYYIGLRDGRPVTVSSNPGK